MIEIWKPIKGYEGFYEVSCSGNIKSISRIMQTPRGTFISKERILKQCVDNQGYLMVTLYFRNIGKTLKVHKLVAINFLNHTPCGYKLVINHKDFNIKNNNVNNLEIVSARENSNKKHIKSSSRYTGVCWHKKSQKWVSQIRINGKLKYLGIFKNEIDANNAYQNKLKLII